MINRPRLFLGSLLSLFFVALFFAGPAMSQLNYTQMSGDMEAVSRVPYLQGRTNSSDYGPWLRVGYINTTGNYVTKPNYQIVDSFSEGLALVAVRSKSGRKYGFINNQGREVIAPSYLYAESFADGVALVSTAHGVGFIGKNGHWVVKPMFHYANSFSEGLAVVQVGSKFGLINKAGKLVIEPRFDVAQSFKEELAAVKIGSKWGFINASGKLAIKPKYMSVQSFSEGLVAVEVETEGTGKTPCKQFGYINRYDQFVIKPQFAIASSFEKCKASVSKWSGKASGPKLISGTIDREGHMTVCQGSPFLIGSTVEPIDPHMPKPFSDGGAFGYRKNGRIVIPAKLVYALPFSKDGLALAGYCDVSDVSKHKRAREAFRTALRYRGVDDYKAIAYFSRAIESDGRCGAAYYMRALTQLEPVSGQFEPKTSDMKVIFGDLENAISCRFNTVDALAMRADLRRKLKKNDEALADYSKCLELDPECISVLQCRAEILLEKGRKKEALADLSKAIALQAKLGVVERAIRMISFNKGRSADRAHVREFLSDVHSRSYTVGDAILMRADLLMGLGRYQEAKQDYTTLISLTSSGDNMWAELLRCKSTCNMHLHNYKEAAMDLSGAIAIDPNIEPDLQLRKECYFKLGNHRQAVEDLSSLIDLASRAIPQTMYHRPNSGPANYLYRERARLYLILAKYELAIKDCDTVLADSPNCGESWNIRSQANQGLNRSKEALLDMCKAREFSHGKVEPVRHPKQPSRDEAIASTKN